MEYSYSKPKSAPSYQTAPPSRVSPVGASSFSGPKGGGGLFPFLPIPGTTPTASPDATSSAGENAARNAAAFKTLLLVYMQTPPVNLTVLHTCRLAAGRSASLRAERCTFIIHDCTTEVNHKSTALPDAFLFRDGTPEPKTSCTIPL